jgi:hypothetical protein
MAAAAQPPMEQRARAGWLRRFGPTGAQIVGAIVACTLWTGVASPGLKLLPGLDGLSDEGIAISLQSAVLGIDDGSNRPAEERARAAAAVLGLTYAESLLSPAAVHAGAAARADGTVTPGIVSLGELLAGELAASPLAVTPGNAAAPVASASPAAPSSAETPPAATPSAAAPPAPSAPRAATPAALPAAPSAPPAAPSAAALSGQTVEFSSSAPAHAVVGGTYAVAASASSGLLVKYSIVGNKDVCKLSGSTVSFRQTGTCLVEAHQPGSAKYKEARAQQAVVVGRAAQTIVFSSSPPAHAFVGGPAYSVAAVASSGLPVSFAAGTGSGGVCKVSGSTVSLTGAGTCTVEAEQGGNSDFERAPRMKQSFTVVAAPAALSHQSISFTTTAPAMAVVGGPIYSVAAAASSGLAVSFAAASSSAGICTVSGSVVAFIGEGTCTVLAHQVGDDLYLAAPTVQQAFPVDRAPQAVSFVSSPPGSATAGSTAYTVAAAATSGLPVSIAVVQSSASVCAISGATVTAIDTGTCTIEANQPGDQTFQPATQVLQSFAVGSPAPSLSGQTINFTSTPPAAATIGGPDYTVAAAASSGLGVTFSASAGSAGICSVSGSTVALLGTGTCTILADQTGSAGYHPAPQAQQSFAIGRASQAISFGSTPPVPAAVGGPDYVVAASASSGLPVSFAAAPASSGVCTVSGSNVSLSGAGTCTVVASQGGNAAYDPADPVQQSFTVGAGAPTLSPQTINYTSTAPGTAVVGGPAYTVAAAASSGLAVVFTIAPASAGVCTISGATVSPVGVGTCTINANQPGSAAYEPALQVQQSFSVATPPPASQTISFTSSAPGAAVYGGPGYTVSATASSGLPVTFSAAPSSAGVCTVSGATVAIVGAGTCRVNANQGGNGSYLAAPQVQQSFTVARASQTITITSTPPPVDKHSPPYTITATSTSGLAVTFSIAPSSAAICSISGSSVSFKKHGDCIVRANQAGNANYLPAPQVQQVITVLNHA